MAIIKNPQKLKKKKRKKQRTMPGTSGSRL
jgi:hypothetical protein